MGGRGKDDRSEHTKRSYLLVFGGSKISRNEGQKEPEKQFAQELIKLRALLQVSSNLLETWSNMAAFKTLFLVGLLVAAVSSQAGKKQTGSQTRGNFGGQPGFPGGGFGGGFQQGGFQQGGFPGGGFPGAGGAFPGGVQGGFVQPTGHVGAVVGGISQPVGSSGCRYWCKTPEGQAYCCESSSQPAKHPVAAIVDKPGLCPPVRAVCPLRSHIGAPQTCSKHGDCFNQDRCCFDRCLGEHVCKEPVY
ncbi:WAP-type 'four-disulfide core' domain [Trinorchestia longiramus]|nr:WAP-type 'four-disulfide core' domain [Trinorchestia longiramus]